MAGTLIPSTVSTKQQRIAQLAREAPERALHSLSHHIDLEWMLEAYRRTRKDGATGIDGRTGADYAVKLEGNLLDLLGRAKSGDAYKAHCTSGPSLPTHRCRGRVGSSCNPESLESLMDTGFCGLDRMSLGHVVRTGTPGPALNKCGTR